MKRITLIVTSFICLIMLQSCTTEEPIHDHVDSDTISEVFEYSNVNFLPSNNYSVILNFPFTTYSSDMVLVYRLIDSGSSGDVWKLMPETYYFDDGTLDFGFTNDFTTNDVQVKLIGFDLPALSNTFKLNQVIRVVVIPANLRNKTTKKADFNNYEIVSKRFKLENSKIVKIKI